MEVHLNQNAPQEEIPHEVAETERIIRGIYSPHNLKSDKTLKNNVFTLRAEIDEGVSVLRLDYSDVHRCKTVCKGIEKPEVKKNYYGLALLLVSGIIAASNAPDSTAVVYTPQPGIPEHAEIYYFINGEHYSKHPKGTQMPAAISIMIDKLLAHAKAYIDKTPEDQTWGGDDLAVIAFGVNGASQSLPHS